MKHIVIATLFAALPLTACQTAAAPANTAHHDMHDEPRPYYKDADARADVNAALAQSQVSGKHALIVMGANWCHDSRGLAAQFDKGRLQTLIDDHYELVYVDVGQKNRNINIAQDFGVEAIVGTPTVFVVAPTGEVLNLDTAPTWRNAASRSEDEIYRYFRGFAHPPSGE